MSGRVVRIEAEAWCVVDDAGAGERGAVAITVEDDRIVDIEPIDTGRVGRDGTGTVLVPGFVDLQVNGVGTVDFAFADAAEWKSARREQLAHGTTACCPTFVTAPLDSYAPWLTRLRDAQVVAALHDDETAILGAHLEGPFLGGAPGAHRVGLIRAANPDWLSELLEGAAHLTRIFTIAPEADVDGRARVVLANHGVIVALGHTTASYDECVAAADRGARAVTHLFNAMGPLEARAPGVAGAALDDDRLTPTLIADFVHVHPALLRMAIARKRNIALVTDAVAVGIKTGEGHRARDARVVTARDGAARLEDDTLAGSTLTMDQAVRNVVGLGIPLARAVEMAATVPCDLLGLGDRGRLEVGAAADIVALDRESLQVRAVWHRGVPVA